MPPLGVYGQRETNMKHGDQVSTTELLRRCRKLVTEGLTPAAIGRKLNRTKRRFLAESVRGVNADGRFGRWVSDALLDPADIGGVLSRPGTASSTG